MFNQLKSDNMLLNKLKYGLSFTIALALVLTTSFMLYSQQVEITADELEEHVTFLASDSLKGRYPGTPEDKVAAEYIRNEFMNAGLAMLGDFGNQVFEVATGIEEGDGNYLYTQQTYFEPFIDFAPVSYSASELINAKLMFCGYGLVIDTDSVQWNEMPGEVVKDKWVMILRGHPDVGDRNDLFARYSGDRDKVIAARDAGAAGVFLVSPEHYDEYDRFEQLTFDKTTSDVGIPVIQLKRSTADAIIGFSGKSIKSFVDQISENPFPFTFSFEINIEARADVEYIMVDTYNVMGMVEGSDPELKNEYIVVGAHYDHLGFGGMKSGSRTPQETAIHNGADDNASGVAGVIELAEKLNAEKPSLQRSVIFVAFGAEEMGLLGSKYFIDNCPVEVDNIVAMINFDMIGRFDEKKNSIAIGGTGTSKETEKILEDVNNDRFELGLSPEGYGPSDHAAFYAKDIPVFFISTGAHTDYHTPRDDAGKLNYEGQQAVLDFSAELVKEIANYERTLTFREAGPKEQQGRGYNLKVTLGIMPDFTSSSGDGLPVDGVNKDGPAYKGGMKKGDVITAIEGQKVGDIYDYMARLKKLSAGQTITVDVERDGKKEVLIIQL